MLYLGLVLQIVFQKETEVCTFLKKWTVEPCLYRASMYTGSVFGHWESEIHRGSLFPCLQSPTFSCVPFSPPTDGAGAGTKTWLCLGAELCDLFVCLVVLFCFSLKHKDAPNLWQDCTSLCPNNHEAGWETEILSLCPLPLLLKNCHTVQGLFRSWGGAMPAENSPFLGLLDVWILKIYIKSEKSNVWKGRLRLCF